MTPAPQSQRLELPDVTLCCVDTRTVDKALDALRHCLQFAHFAEVLFFGPGSAPAPEQGNLPEQVRWIPIPALNGIQDYNQFMLRELVHHVDTSHVLVIQWDGFITHPSHWNEAFLEWDYIGAPWYHGGHPGMVGNGGFSLRSRRLLQALQDMPIDVRRPEDAEICVHLQAELSSRHGIRIAPLALAQAFACEYGRYRPSFGFHGMHNFAHVLDQPALAAWLADVPVEILVHQHTRKLVKELIRIGRRSEARTLIRLRAHHQGWTLDQCMLMLRTLLPARSPDASHDANGPDRIKP